MKIVRIIFLVFFLVLNVPNVLADNEPPPPPPAAAKGAASTALAPPAPGLPINQDLPYLIAAGLLLGTAVICRNKIKKASI
ncbi:hypothetical protein [Flavobacterium johnsoniae]|uniref:hypothetical protein n=1 Tax=Flavobacterium johnsoniae TaxID=986 RepID=UPI0011EE6058|nr:hypothetical protein [Flavobacterium johnsoniae]